MKKNNQGRASEIIFAIILLASTGLTVFSFVQMKWQVLLEGWNNLNGMFGESLFEFNVTAIAFLVLSCVIAFFALITAIMVFANAKVKGVFLKILFACVCIEKILYCLLFMFKMNTYWASPLVASNMIIWVLMIFITMLEVMVAILMLLLACNKKIFAPVTLVFAVILAVVMCAEIVNTYVYTFFEIPLLPEVPVWQNAEILNEGIANMACYWSLCFALMGIFLSISKVRSSIKFGTFVPQAETIEDNFFKDSVVVPKTIINSEENNQEENEEDNEEVESTTEEETTEIVEEMVEENADVEGVPELLPEIDTDENFKFDVDLAAELKELFGEEESMENVAEEVSVEQTNPVKKIAAQAAAAELISLTMRLQKGEISDEEYNQLKKDLFDKL